MADAGALKELNLHLVRLALEGGAAMSKTSLAAATGLSFPTVSRTVDALAEAGELRGRGMQASTGGRAAKLYALDPAFNKFLLLRLEGETLHWSLRDRFGTCLDSAAETCPSPYLEQIAALIQRVQVRNPQLRTVAFGIAAYVHQGVVYEAELYPELRGVNLRTEFQDRCSLPVVVENDMPSAALGYWAAHRDEACDAASCIYIGNSGPGCATVLDGRPLRGHRSFAGEIFYLPMLEKLRKDGPPDFRRIDMTAFYAELVQNLAALIAPDRVILYKNPYLQEGTERIRARCCESLPSYNVPELVISDDFGQDYERGLWELAKRLWKETANEVPISGI